MVVRDGGGAGGEALSVEGVTVTKILITITMTKDLVDFPITNDGYTPMRRVMGVYTTMFLKPT